MVAMAGDNRSWTDILARARQRLLTDGEGDGAEEALGGVGPRDEILASWRRSYDEGARTSGLSTPYDDNINLSSRLVRAAEPVIGRVQEDVLGSPITVVLADSRGKVLIRRSGEPNLESRLDNALLAPGFNYAERYVGTNGIGTALEGKSTQSVVGFEHFNEHLQAFACVGVPLRDPVTRRQLGVLDITTWADRAHPALTALVRQAASVIEEGLMQMSSRGAQELLHEYLVASRNREDQVLAISQEAFIASSGAIRRIGNLSREELWPVVRNALATRDKADVPLLTGVVGTVPLHLSAVRGPRAELAGAVIRISPSEGTRPQPPPTVPAAAEPGSGFTGAGLNALSPVTVGPSVMVRRLAAARMPVCLIGEPGVGKRTIVRMVAAEVYPHDSIEIYDASIRADGVDSLLSAWRAGSPALVYAADALDPAALGELMSDLQVAAATHTDAHGWLAFTLQSVGSTPRAGAGAGAGAEAVHAALSAAAIPIVVVPPLRGRVQDLHHILPEMLTAASNGQVTGVTPELMNRMVREPWPGNLAEVSAVVDQMVATARTTVLDVGDLPAGFGSGLRRKLSPLEWLAREAIVEALRASNGDKQAAADSLGISRASIYRKIKAYDIDTRKF
jgi:sigma-54 dependent transcriptional regulator, acetoin dehydrogenase operon transcriptional activator AcoR